MKKYLLAIMIPLFLFAIEVNASFSEPTPTGNTTGYAWSESLGWFDFSPVTVSDQGLSGYAYNDNIGWLVLDGITNSNGTLSGYAWSESLGYFDFSNVTIGKDGAFQGYAYNDNSGFLILDDISIPIEYQYEGEEFGVNTTWAPLVPQTENKKRLGSRRRVVAPPTSTPNTNTPNTVSNTQSSPNTIANNPRDLELNNMGDDVKLLQQFLNKKGYTVNPTPGQAGSIGYETNYFGNLTRLALIKFQQANNITPSLGYFGPKTRAFIKTLTN